MKIALINQKINYLDYDINTRSYLDKLRKASEAADIIIGPELSISNISRPMTYDEFMQYCEDVKGYVNNNLIIPGTGIVFSNEQKILSNISPIITKENISFIHKKYPIEIEKKAAKRAGFLKFNEGNNNEEVFNYNGLDIGIEICNDHPKSRLKNSINGHNIDLEFLLACDLDEVILKNIVVKNGIFCYNDGFKMGDKDSIYALKVEEGFFSHMASIDMGDYLLIKHDFAA